MDPDDYALREQFREGALETARAGKYLVKYGTREELAAFGYPPEVIDTILLVRHVRNL
jgi:hypothetical protein